MIPDRLTLLLALIVGGLLCHLFFYYVPGLLGMKTGLPLYVVEDVLKTPILILPVANHDNNQHGANENLRLQNLWDAIEIYAAVLDESEYLDSGNFDVIHTLDLDLLVYGDLTIADPGLEVPHPRDPRRALRQQDTLSGYGAARGGSVV